MKMKMNLLKLKHLIFVFCALISMAAGAASTDNQQDQPAVHVGGRIFCVKPAETYCVHVVNYPSKEIDALLKHLGPFYNTDLSV